MTVDEGTKELPKPEIVTYRREELDLPVVLTGLPSAGQ